MKVALDYDGTYDKSPLFWSDVCMLAKSYGHDIRIVTAREVALDNIDSKVDVPVIYCDGVAKKWFCHHRTDFEPDVWIDDKPQGILENGPLTRSVLEEWRKTRAA